MDFERYFTTAAQSAQFAPSKTPGRAFKGRTKLQENIIQNGAATVNVRSKAPLATPFRQENRCEPHKCIENNF